MLRFEEVRTKRKGDVAWELVERAKFPPLREVEDAFGDKGPDQALFFDTIRKTLARAHSGSPERIAGFYSTASGRFRLFAYLSTQHILSFEVKVEPSLRAWLTALADACHHGELGLEFEFRENGSSIGALKEESADLLDSNPIKLLLANVPRSFKRSDERAKKAAHLAKLVAKRGPTPKPNAAALDRAFQAFLSARKHKKAPPKGMDAKLKALGARLGEKLPLALEVLYRRADGGKKLFFDHDMLSLRALEENWAMWNSVYDEWSLDDLTGNIAAQRGVTNALYCCPKWIPFIDLGGGNCLGIDLLPGPRGSVGQVILFGRDVATIRRVAPDLKTFLDECLTFDGEKGVLVDVFTSLAF
jgi:cell wall assembly regulator SMI1